MCILGYRHRCSLPTPPFDMSYQVTGAGEHCLLQIRKSNANTEWVSQQIARFAGVRKFDVGYAGLKDRQAITTQWYSCWKTAKTVIEIRLLYYVNLQYKNIFPGNMVCEKSCFS